MVASILKEKIQQRLNEEVPTKFDNENWRTANPQWREMNADWEKTQRDFKEWIVKTFSSLSNEFLSDWKSNKVSPDMTAGAWNKLMDNTQNKLKNINEFVKIIKEYKDIVVNEITENDEMNIGKTRQTIKKVQTLKSNANGRLK